MNPVKTSTTRHRRLVQNYIDKYYTWVNPETYEKFRHLELLFRSSRWASNLLDLRWTSRYTLKEENSNVDEPDVDEPLKSKIEQLSY